MTGLFERINFFKGLFMQAEDWQKEQQYHMEKRRFHNMYLHTPGVAFNCAGEMKVTASQGGTAFTVAPGYAIDGEGRDLYLPESREIKLPPLQAFNPPTTVFITIAYEEIKSDMRPNDANPRYAGYAYVTEDTIIEISTRAPDNIKTIELARIALSESAAYIKDASPLVPPGPDEIDLTHVPAAGTPTVSTHRQLSLSDLGEKLMDTTIQVRIATRKQEDTSVLIEKVQSGAPQPMYMVHVQAMDDAHIQWWIECRREEGDTSDYTLHIKNDSNRTSTVLCRVFKMRI